MREDKNKKETKKMFLRLIKPFRLEVVKIRRLISKTKLTESNVALFIFLKIFLVEND